MIKLYFLIYYSLFFKRQYHRFCIFYYYLKNKVFKNQNRLMILYLEKLHVVQFYARENLENLEKIEELCHLLLRKCQATLRICSQFTCNSYVYILMKYLEGSVQQYAINQLINEISFLWEVALDRNGLIIIFHTTKCVVHDA